MWWDSVDKIIYINLEDAVDRKNAIENELSMVPSDKIIRFNAIQGKMFGCSQSHIECLKLAIQNNWKNVLILEDDAMFQNYDDSIKIFESLCSKPYDVILLGGCSYDYDESTYKLYVGQTTHAYIVSNHYYHTLIKNYEEGLDGLIQTGDYPKYALDQNWKLLQSQDNWFIVSPPLMIQRPGYSYIEGEYVDYTIHFQPRVH